MKPKEINLTAQISGIAEATEAAEKLSEKINEAKTLADELASLIDGLELKVQF